MPSELVAPGRRAPCTAVMATAAVLFCLAACPARSLDFLPRISSLLHLSERASDEIREEERISEALDQNADYRSLYQSMENPGVQLYRHVKPGEELLYQAKWRGLPAGSIRLAAKRMASLRNRPVFVFELSVESNDFLGTFYPVNNSLNSYADAASGRSYLIRRRISERDRQYKDRLEFKYDSLLPNGLPNPVSRYSLVDDKGLEVSSRPFPIPDNLQDVVSCIYYLRGMSLSRTGDSCVILLGSRQKPVMARITVVAEERLSLPGLGVFDCLVVEAGAEGANLTGNLLATRGDERIWLERHCLVPVRVSADLPPPLGNVTATLVQTENCQLLQHAVAD